MRLPGLIAGVPKIAFVLVVPVVAFLLMITLGLALSGGDDDKTDALPTLAVAVQRAAATLTPVTAAAAPTATPPAFRTNCAQIFGGDYQNDAERTWFLQNCDGAVLRTGTPAAGGASSGGASAPAATTATYAAETLSNDRLVIPKIGVDAPVSYTSVGGDGVMPDPSGYFNAVLYDFGAIPGLGGSPSAGGNAVLAGHVDCGRCGPGGTPALAVFYYVRNLGVGDVIQYYTAGVGMQSYVVSYAGDLLPNADWVGVVSAGTADLTIITCTGTFTGGEYTHRRVVQARKA